LAMSALFEVTPREEALAVAKKFVSTQAQSALLLELEEPLARNDAYSIIEPFVRKRKQLYETMLPHFDSPERRDEFLALLDAIAASVGAPDANEDTSRYTLPLVSRVFGALEVWHFDLEGLRDRKDQETLALVVDRALRGMRIDRDALRRELASAYYVARALTPRGIYAHVREVAVAVNWHAAAAEPIDARQLQRALIHPSSVVRNAAFELLAEGAAAGEERDVLAGALEEAPYGAARVLVQVVPRVIGIDAAEALIRERLRNGSQRPWRLRGVFEGLAYVAAELRNGLKAEIFTALRAPNSMIVCAAAKTVAKLEHDCTAEFVAILREAAGFWQARPLWCGWCEMEVADQTCPKCKREVESPLPILQRELDRCGASAAR
ncbi:MAG TPA: hypothetical protein VEK11_04510, partial [Thermoanaerobaculia bacterium]|nr:hypothetical protein [Thermoanaerobaculia bacterium]